MPREHGAYVELAFVLLTALALGRMRSAQLLLAVSAIAVFVAHEPFLVILGERGKRALDRVKNRALSVAAAALAVATIFGVAGLWLLTPPARAAILLPLFFAACLVALIVARREKTALGELLVALTFASALVPLALAGDSNPRAAWIAGSVWAVIFSLETFTVRSVKANAREKFDPRRPFAVMVMLSFAAVLVACVLAAAGILPPLAAAAIVPSAVITLTCGLLRAHPRHLRTVGWSFAASNVAAWAALLLALR